MRQKGISMGNGHLFRWQARECIPESFRCSPLHSATASIELRQRLIPVSNDVDDSGSGNGGSGSGSSNRVTPTPTIEATTTPMAIPTVVPTFMPIATTPVYTEVETGFPFTSGGNSFTRDLLYDKATNKQFIAIETKNGDIFYMIIDYDKPLDEKGEKYETYFLNLVDSRDLLDIVDSEDIPAEPEVIYVTPEPTTVPTLAPAPVVEAEPKKDSSNGTTVGVIGLLLIAAGGALWYFKLRKNGSGKGNPSMDDYGFDDDDDEDAVQETEDE